jgi:MFS family permease
VQGPAALLGLRSLAWVARGFRGPLRDDMLAGAVDRTHYGRAFGLERAGDMLGAVAGPLMAAVLVWAGVHSGAVILGTLVPGLVAAGAMFLLTREPEAAAPGRAEVAVTGRAPFPARFRVFLVGVLLFGLGDFSRTFLIWLAARSLGEEGHPAGGMLPAAVLLYALHNAVSAVAAYGIGHLADRGPRVRWLLAGYALGVGTNVLLAALGGSFAWLVVVIVLSGISVAASQTLEKATAAELLPGELRSLGFGTLACANAVGDMASSLYVGALLQAERPAVAFGIAAAVGLAGVVWMGRLARAG